MLRTYGLLFASGCFSSAAIDSAVHEDRFDFNEVIIRSWNEQLLLNIVRLRYRDYWFFIDDRDLNSKSTFNLFTHILNLKSGEEKMLGPLITVPAR